VTQVDEQVKTWLLEIRRGRVAETFLFSPLLRSPMDEPFLSDVYLGGRYSGVYRSGTVIRAKKDEECIVKGRYYVLEAIVADLGMCARHRHLVVSTLDDLRVDGIHKRNSFEVDEECLRLQKSRTTATPRTSD
jgi:hypothetical protein